MPNQPPLRLAFDKLRLGTSPPNDGGEDAPAAVQAPILSPTNVGERCRALSLSKGETERGNKKSRSRRKPGTTERARALRWIENSAEGLLWQELKGRRLGGYRFTRQFPIGPYFADFCCRAKRLVIEIDGSQHADSSYDRKRDAFMRSQGYSILRFWNHDLLKHRGSVCETILAALDGRLAEDITAFDLRFVYARPSPDREPLTLNQQAGAASILNSNFPNRNPSS